MAAAALPEHDADFAALPFPPPPPPPPAQPPAEVEADADAEVIAKYAPLAGHDALQAVDEGGGGGGDDDDDDDDDASSDEGGPREYVFTIPPQQGVEGADRDAVEDQERGGAVQNESGLADLAETAAVTAMVAAVAAAATDEPADVAASEDGEGEGEGSGDGDMAGATLSAGQVEALVALRLRQLDREHFDALGGTAASATASTSALAAAQPLALRSLASVRPDLAARRPDLAAKIEALQRLRAAVDGGSGGGDGIGGGASSGGGGSTAAAAAAPTGSGAGAGGSEWETFDDFPEDYSELQLRDSEAIRHAKAAAKAEAEARAAAAAAMASDKSPSSATTRRAALPGVRAVSPLPTATRAAIRSAMGRITISPQGGSSPMAEALAQQALERGRLALQAHAAAEAAKEAAKAAADTAAQS